MFEKMTMEDNNRNNRSSISQAFWHMFNIMQLENWCFIAERKDLIQPELLKVDFCNNFPLILTGKVQFILFFSAFETEEHKE